MTNSQYLLAMLTNLSKKELEKEKKRSHILNTVEFMLKENSLDSITMDEIAVKAAISKGALYLHFASIYRKMKSEIKKEIQYIYSYLIPTLYKQTTKSI